MRNTNAFFIEGSIGKLNAKLDMPELEAKQQCPMVIFCHGLAGNLDYHLWPPLAAKLNEHGLGVLRFDFNGCGKSEGEFMNMTISNEVNDLLNVIAHVRSLPHTRTISLLGHSQGGVVAGIAAGQCGKEQITSLSLLSAAAVMREDSLRGSIQGAQFDPWHLDQEFYVIPGKNLKLGRAYIQDVMKLPIYRLTSAYDGPAHVLNGMADQVVPYTYAERYHHVLKNSELVIVPGENHFWSHNPEYAVELVASWLIAHLV